MKPHTSVHWSGTTGAVHSVDRDLIFKTSHPSNSKDISSATSHVLHTTYHGASKLLNTRTKRGQTSGGSVNRSSVIRIGVAPRSNHRLRVSPRLCALWYSPVKEDKTILSIMSDVQETLSEDAMFRVVARKQNGRNHSGVERPHADRLIRP